MTWDKHIHMEVPGFQDWLYSLGQTAVPVHPGRQQAITQGVVLHGESWMELWASAFGLALSKLLWTFRLWMSACELTLNLCLSNKKKYWRWIIRSVVEESILSNNRVIKEDFTYNRLSFCEIKELDFFHLASHMKMLILNSFLNTRLFVSCYSMTPIDKWVTSWKFPILASSDL